MTGKQKSGIVVLVVVAVLFYMTLGVGLMRGEGGGTDSGDTPDPPRWTKRLDRLTAPLQPRLRLDQSKWTLEDRQRVEIVVPESEKEARRAEFVIESNAGATITYDCGCTIDGEAVEPSTLPEPPDPGDEEAGRRRPFPGTTTVRFSVLGEGGTLVLRGRGEGSHTITLE